MWKIAEDEYLCHYGVPGMRKGVRRNRPKTHFGKPDPDDDFKPIENKSIEVKPIENKSIEVKPIENKTIQMTNNGQAKPSTKTAKELQYERRKMKAYHKGVGMPTKEFHDWKEKRRNIYPHLN